jgi:WD40 repeat protein
MKNDFHPLKKQIIIMVMAAVLLSACIRTNPPTPTNSPTPDQPPIPTAEPTASPTPVEPTDTPAEPSPTPPVVDATQIPELPVISLDNLDQLQEAARFDFNLADKLDWSEDGRILTVKSREMVALYDVDSDEVTETIAFGEPEVVLDSCADNSMVAASQDQQDILLYSAETGAVLFTLETQGMIYNASFSPDGSLLAVPMADEIAIELFDTETGELEQRLSGFETAAPVYGAAFSSSGNQLIWISRGRVQTQNISSGALGPDFGHQEFVSAVVLSQDDMLLAVATAGTVNEEYTPVIQLWDATSGMDRGVLLPGDEIPSAMDIAPGGELLANTFSSELQFWNLETGEQAGTLTGHTDRVTAAAFSPDGRMLATAALDGTVRLWKIMP